jgi:hypothetical protein
LIEGSHGICWPFLDVVRFQQRGCTDHSKPLLWSLNSHRDWIRWFQQKMSKTMRTSHKPFTIYKISELF